MKESEIHVKPLLYSEINQLRNFPPEDWRLDLPEFLLLHFGKPYFYPIAATLNEKIVGVGNGILNGNAGWLGNIIVLPEFRRRGIGYKVTEHLVSFFNRNGCISQLLIATELGEPVYEKIGFKRSSTYIFYGAKKRIHSQRDKNIRRITEDDLPSITKLDKEATGEDREHLLKRFLSNGWVQETDRINGFFLPDFGTGLVISKNRDAGIELLNVKHSNGNMTTVVPSENTAARHSLERQGFSRFLEVPRMVLGKELNWKPEFIYNRAAGYCG